MKINKVKNYDYDAIVIGSGIGGLTVASILAQMNKKRVRKAKYQDRFSII